MTFVPRLTVVIPTFNGGARLRRLLEALARQTLPPEDFEVIAVDDGSSEPPAPQLAGLRLPYAFRLLTQANSGAAAARDLGANAARAATLAFVDDDMEVPEEFLARHAELHRDHSPLVVLGEMRGATGAAAEGLYERWHQLHLDKRHARMKSGARIRGHELFSGNVSMRKRDYLAVGGFDVSLRRGHDAELGLRLERAGVRFVFSDACWSRHETDCHDDRWWRDRAVLYGRIACRVSRKHPDVPHANPWELAKEMNRGLRPCIALAARWPKAAVWAGSGILFIAKVFFALGFERLAMTGVSATYTMDYFRGLVDESAAPKLPGESSRSVAERPKAIVLVPPSPTETGANRPAP